MSSEQLAFYTSPSGLNAVRVLCLHSPRERDSSDEVGPIGSLSALKRPVILSETKNLFTPWNKIADFEAKRIP